MALTLKQAYLGDRWMNVGKDAALRLEQIIRDDSEGKSVPAGNMWDRELARKGLVTFTRVAGAEGEDVYVIPHAEANVQWATWA